MTGRNKIDTHVFQFYVVVVLCVGLPMCQHHIQTEINQLSLFSNNERNRNLNVLSNIHACC
jgi:hypothetical protein